MSDSKSESSARQRLLAHQCEFIDRYLSSPQIKLHLLVAPPGSGATTTAVEIVARLTSSGGPKRILILVEQRALLAHLEFRLREGRVTPVLVDRYRYRQLEDSGQFTSSPWDLPGVYLCTVQFAVQSDIRERLLSTEWDLLLYDAPLKHGSRNMEFLSQFLTRPELASAIILSNDPGSHDRLGLPPETSVTKWDLRLLLDWDNERLWRSGAAQIEAIHYHLLESEIANREAAKAVAEEAATVVRDEAANSLLASILGSYDPYSTEIRLRSFYTKLKEHRNLVAHGRKGEDHFIDELRVIEPLLRRIEAVLERLESQESDQKLEAVVGRLMQTSDQTQRIVITTFSIATGQYLASSLEPVFKQVHAISSAVAPADVEKAIQDLRSSGGLLISSIAMLEGVDLKDTDVLVPYDPPRTAHNAVTLLGRFVRVGRSNPLRILVPVDDQSASDGRDSGLTLIEEALSALGAT